MTILDIAGEPFRVEIEGPDDAPVLMISNSLGTNLHMWDGQMAVFTKHFRVVRYDSRGHGESTAPPGPYSLDQLGRDAVAILDALGIEKAHWLGLSKGGMVGQWMLTHARERIGRAVLANTSAHMGMPDGWNDRMRLVREQGMAAITDGVIDRWFTKTFQKARPDEIDRIRAMLHATPPQGYMGCMSAIRDMDQREAIRAVTNPVLVIIGSEDPATTPEQGKVIASNIAGAKTVILDAAHLSNVEDADAFTQAVIKFLTAPAAANAKPARTSTRTAVRKPVRTAARESARKPLAASAKKATKKAAKKSAKKAVKKPTKKGVKKGSKKAVKKGVKKGSKKSVKRMPVKAVKKITKKTIKSTIAKRLKPVARKSVKSRSVKSKKSGR